MSQKAIQVISTAIGILSLLWSSLVVLYSLVDPLAPILIGFSIPFILLSLLGNKGGLIIKIFGVLFTLSLIVSFWTSYDIRGNQSTPYSKPLTSENTFIKCSNTMFSGVTKDQTQLTRQQQTDINLCISKGN